LQNATAYELNAPQVASETIDDEAVVIHLHRGSYFSIRGVGSVIWSYLLGGVVPSEIVARLTRQYGDDQIRIAGDVESFIHLLKTEDLLRPRNEASPPGNDTGFADGPAAYEAPSLEKFTDMEALLLLDPIHDVDEQGWPNRPEG
jgi:hypothetical protein